jgi:DAACS family dicarboxylate/amino acid:cation (Na+ or H+) symporter
VKLHTKILLGLGLGAAAGVAANAVAADSRTVAWINEYVAGPVGQIFLRMLLMTIIPLVFASIALGVAGIGDIRKVGRVGGKTLFYFLLSSAIAGFIGIVLTNVLDPGGGMDPGTRQQLFDTFRSQVAGAEAGETGFGINMLINLVPRNPVQAAASMDMLGVIFFSLVFGAAITVIPAERARPMVRVLEALSDIVIKIIDFAMLLAPYGVFGLVFVVTSRFGWGILRQLGMYFAVVMIGYLIHAGVGISALVRIFGRMSPLQFWKKARLTVLTGFSTSSSYATLPTNISVAEREMGVSPAVAGFVLPLGATMNMNGTAVYLSVTVLFLARVFGVALTIPQEGIVVFLSVIMAVGAAGVPSGSLPLIMVVLATFGIPAEGIAIVLGVDRILDMCRTVLNVTGDLSAAVYIQASEPQLAHAGEHIGLAPSVNPLDGGAAEA